MVLESTLWYFGAMAPYEQFDILRMSDVIVTMTMQLLLVVIS